MVRAFLSKLTAPVRGLHQAAYLLAGLTLASQILALARDRIFAHTFGAGEVLDMYYAAFKIPDLVFALVASLVSAYVLIPRIASMQKEESRKLLSETASFLVIAGGIVCLALAALAPAYLFLLFPTFAHSAHAPEFVALVRILLIQPILLGLSGILGSVTQIKRRFVLFALSPVLYNLGIILGTVLLYPRFGILGIGAGVVVGAIAHLALNIPIAAEAKLLPRPAFPTFKTISSVVKSSVPRSLALGMGTVTTLGLLALASRLGSGSVSVFTLAGNLEAVPLSLIGAAYATAAFPVLAEQHGKGERDAFQSTIGAAARQIILWSSVILVLTVVLRAHIVRIILGSGAFDWGATRLTAAILGIMVLSLMAQGIILLAARAFYAAHRSWNPLLVQLADCGISVLSAWGLVRLGEAVPMVRYFIESLFRVTDVPGAQVLFVACGFTIGQLIMGFVALITLRAVAPGTAGKLVRPILESFGAALLGGTAAYGALTLMGNIAPLTKLYIVVAEGLVAGMVGLAVASGVLTMLRNQEMREVWSAVAKLRSLRPLKPYAPISNDQTNP
ncbi:MAG TPA: lipid II flippase MurJ [Candidatus Paceibacterota bacterium]|jgi:putative peptidoglycan lipid II flippase|nr:lipid II flippase MurJ [Candidatus Paceibacterota bacterium]